MPLCVPDVHCYSHSISWIVHVHVQIQKEQSSKSQPFAQPQVRRFTVQTPSCAAEKEHGHFILSQVVGRQFHLGCCLFLQDKVLTSHNMTAQRTWEVSSQFLSVAPCKHHGSNHNVPCPAFRRVTGDDACWNLTIPRGPQCPVQFLAARLQVRHSELCVHCDPTPNTSLSPAPHPSSSEQLDLVLLRLSKGAG